ncbi:hypothetical protein [Actinomadura parmotrematis]|uniref:XRE family transcriptional regulator n=1 Tax=Actinomadura parmotrematis TaxID=2864039 RepID=A0ABS7FWS8_9ACTN|nr:hypothetical protein [Actinomadura parmotrematis]MBW8484771.1 hypothetical protein [Actinomadura parmotrematis]
MSTDRRAVGARLRALREAPPRWSRAEMSRLLRAAADPRDRAAMPHVETLTGMIKAWERGDHLPGPRYRPLYARVHQRPESDLFPAPAAPALIPTTADDTVEALDLARRVAASDVGGDTLTALEAAVDDLASAYPTSDPGHLLGRIRRHLHYVDGLLDARMTLAERRRLIAVGGWLSLLAATCHIDLHQRAPAAARLRSAAALAWHAEHSEIAAWCLETEAWQALTEGNHRRALDLSRAARQAAPRGSSAFIQATAQEGRAWARLGDADETRRSLTRVERLVAPLATPDRPEHHYRYDPAKSDAYTATTLAWIGDAAAEPYARAVLGRLEGGEHGPPRPRRAASARLDLSLALLAADRPDEAAHTALEAITSGRLVPSNHWRAREVLTAVKARQVPEAATLSEALHDLCNPPNKQDVAGSGVAGSALDS